jgi:hypothetical protein
MKFFLVLGGLVATCVFFRLALLRGVWLIHMKMEEFQIFWQDYTPMLVWSLLALVSAVGTGWFLAH